MNLLNLNEQDERFSIKPLLRYFLKKPNPTDKLKLLKLGNNLSIGINLNLSIQSNYKCWELKS